MVKKTEYEEDAFDRGAPFKPSGLLLLVFFCFCSLSLPIKTYHLVQQKEKLALKRVLGLVLVQQVALAQEEVPQRKRNIRLTQTTETRAAVVVMKTIAVVQ
jgi:hypothetical protein